MFNPFKTETLNLKGKNGRIDKASQRTWSGEDGIFHVATGGEILISPISLKKMVWFYILISLFFLVFLGRVFYWQVIKNNSFVGSGRGMQMEIIKAKRGLFLDRNLQPLVKNIANFSLEVTPAQFKPSQNELVLNQIKSYLTPEQNTEIDDNLKKMPAYANEGITLIKKLDYNQAIIIKTIIFQTSGIDVALADRREYADPLAFSHALGYVGRISKDELSQRQYSNYLFDDFIGKSGLEAVYEKYLRGQDGQQRTDILPDKQEEVVYNKPPINGDNLVLNIDGDLQKKLFDSLSTYVRANGNRGGAAVALDPNNGEVLAIVSYPSFDNTAISRGLSQNEFDAIYNNRQKPLFFRTILGEYPSGSTIKPVVAAAALEEKIITPLTTVLSTGGISYGGWFFADWKAGGHGITNVIKALAESVNTFFYYVGGGYGNFKGLGPDKLAYWFARFGLGKITGIDLAGEKSGFVPTPSWKKSTQHQSWYPGDTYHISIGQGDLLVTPLQVANYTAAVANNGTLYQPEIVKEIIQPDEKVIAKIEPKILSTNLASKQSLEVVRAGMRAAVTSGSARSLSTLPVPAAAKTGTAQNTSGAPHAWFTCFAPYDHPQIVLTILVENGVEGSVAAAPVARDVLSWWAQNKK